MTEDSIEFAPLSEEISTESGVRTTYRVPVSDKENILARIEGQTYSVANISVSGIAIPAGSCLDFEAGQILEDTELWIGTDRLENLTGKVIHCSVHDGGYLRFGIQWLNLTSGETDFLETAIRQLKKRALKTADPEGP